MTATGVNRRASRPRPVDGGDGSPYDVQQVRFRDERVTTPRFRREDLRAGQRIDGPLIVDEPSCTTVIPDGWALDVDPTGAMRVRRS